MQSSDGIKYVRVGRVKPRRRCLKYVSRRMADIVTGAVIVVALGVLAGAGFGIGIALVAVIL